MNNEVTVEVYPSITNVTVQVGKPQKLIKIETGVNFGVSLGTTDKTAARGDQGLVAYEHSQIVNANPHQTTFAQILGSLVVGQIQATGTPDNTTFLRGDGTWSAVTATEVNDLTAAVVWANIPDSNVPQSAVTQHQSALSITESQISDLQAYLLDLSDDTNPALGGILNTNNFPLRAGTYGLTLHDTSGLSATVGGNQFNLDTSGFGLNNAIRVTNIFDEDDMTSDSNIALATQQSIKAYFDNNKFTTSDEINDLTAAVVWANVPNVNITESSVTQHQGALSITESQISDLQSYILTETDTFDSVTSRGNTTANNIQVGNITADSFILDGGAPTDFLKGDGSTDSTSYSPNGS